MKSYNKLNFNWLLNIFSSNLCNRLHNMPMSLYIIKGYNLINVNIHNLLNNKILEPFFFKYSAIVCTTFSGIKIKDIITNMIINITNYYNHLNINVIKIFSLSFMQSFAQLCTTLALKKEPL